MSEKRVAMYKGRRADELTREELIEAYTRACAEVDRLNRTMLEDVDMEQHFARARRVLFGGVF